MVRLGDKHINVQVTLSLVCFFRQYVPRMRMATLDLSRGRQPESLGGTFMCFQFWHYESPSSRLLARLRFLRTAAALMSLWPKNDEHLVPFHPGPRFDFTDVRQTLLQFFQNPRT